MAAEPEPALTRIAGYRLVRVLGEGASAVVHLGYADTADEAEPRRTAAIKVFRAGVTADRIDAEVAALAAVEHPHVLRLVDLATAPDGSACLVLERCATGGLARLVTTRSALAAGEALTVLAPLVGAVDALHAAGVVHRDIRLSSVLFRESGAPVLAGLGRSARIGAGLSPAALAATPEVLDDRRRLSRLVGTVLERVDHPAARGLDAWIAGQPETLDDYPALLADALWKLGEAQPVRLRDGVAEPRPVLPRVPVPAEHGGGHAAPGTRAASRVASVSAAGARLGVVVGAVVGVVRSAAGRIGGHARGVRRRVWIAAGGVAVSLVVALLVVPSGDPAADSRSSPQGAVGESAERSRADVGDVPGERSDAVRERAADGSGDPLRGAGPESSADPARPADPESSADPEPPADAVLGDDPVAAVDDLLALRARCLREISVLCLDGVAQPGSAAMQHDVAVVRALQAGGEQSPDAAIDAVGPVLVERLGDSALLDLGDVPQTQPASALVMRGEAGWRIRDYLDDTGSD